MTKMMGMKPMATYCIMFKTSPCESSFSLNTCLKKPPPELAVSLAVISMASIEYGYYMLYYLH